MVQSYTHTSDILLSWACLTVMITSTMCAAFRWFHMCHPYDENPSHFYPARKLVTVFFLCQLLNIPFLLRPSLDTSVCYSACFEMFIISAFLTTVLNTFFKREVPHRGIFILLLIWIPILVFAIAGIALTFSPEYSGPIINKCLPIFTAVVSLFLGVSILRTMVWILRQIDGYHKAEFSNEADFPYTFAKKLVWLPWTIWALCWLVMIVQSSSLLAIYWLILAVLIGYYTIIILRPQVGSLIINIDEYEQEEATPDSPVQTTDECTSETELRKAIRKRVIEIARSRYLEPHLTRRDIVGMFGFGERTIAGEIITSFGFYDMINALRLEHARRYRELHPNETKESVALNSGFKDRFAMRHGELRVRPVDHEILEGFSPKIE